MPPGVDVGTIDAVGDITRDGSKAERVGTCDIEGATDTLGCWFGARAPVGDCEITLGKSLEPEPRAVGPGGGVGIGDIVGLALDTGANVELPIGNVGIRDTFGS